MSTDDVFVDISQACPENRASIRTLFDAAVLAIDAKQLERAIATGNVLVAKEKTDDNHLLGAVILENTSILAIAVRLRRRDRGIGTALVESALERKGKLVAEFDATVKPFWESITDNIEPIEGTDRYRAFLQDEASCGGY